MTLTKKSIVSLLIAGALLVGFLVGMEYIRNATPALAGVNVSNEYYATTTGNGASDQAAAIRRIKTSGTGCTLGSVYLAEPTIGSLRFYNATTTNVNLRTGNLSTTSILMAAIPPATATSSIPFDISCSVGLIAVFEGTVSSSTITYR